VNLKRLILCRLLAFIALSACSGGSAPTTEDDPSPPLALMSAATAVFVGERTSLTPVFDGDFASIDGIGRVQSGVAVDTPLLPRWG